MRKKLADDNPTSAKASAGMKTGKYLKYAIGEIILVVIGILIALQINNWNQQRLDTIDRNKIVANLNAEFAQNKLHLQKIAKVYVNAENTGIELMSYVGLDNLKELDKRILDSLLNDIFPSTDYLPSNNAIDDIIQSGKLKSLDNPELSSKLSDWKGLLYTLSSREKKLDDWASLEVIPYLNRYISWRDVDVASNSSWATKGELPTNYEYIFSDLEFENILENFIFHINKCSKSYDETIDLVNDIIQLTSITSAHD